jgi:hypothetical protein
MFGVMWKPRDQPVVGGNDRETHNAAEQEPRRKLEKASPSQSQKAPRSKQYNETGLPTRMLVYAASRANLAKISIAGSRPVRRTKSA